MAAPDYAEYRRQLARLPGGPASAMTEFFSACLTGPERLGEDGLPRWPLEEGGWLRLQRAPEGGAVRLVHEDAAQTTEVTRLDADLLTAAQADPDVSPLLLALLAIAAGDVDDGRRLKRRLPRLDAAARDLMLMTLCRLCG